MLYRRKSKCSIIPLTGGLGNQLFQYAFGIYLEHETGRKTVFDQAIGRPRKIMDRVSLETLVSINYESRFLFKCDRLFLNLYSKAFGWRISDALIREQTRNAIRYFMAASSKLLLQIRYRSRLRVTCSRDLGFDSALAIADGGLYIGYFQTYLFAAQPSVFNILKTLSPKHMSTRYQVLLNLIIETKPILLHIRLEDYLKEEKFGIPSVEFYQTSIDLLLLKAPHSKIWIFSDNIHEAKKILLNLNQATELFFFDENELSDTEIWNLMRNFAGYVISNSTFAWWAAFLRMDQTSPVVAPIPWFKGMEDPSLLIPTGWIRVNAA